MISAAAAALFGIYLALVYDTIAAVNSSPQTTEINAKKRAPTLMKWVHIGLAQCAVFVIMGATIAWRTRGPWWAVVLGGGIGMIALYFQYVHARNAGLASEEPGTEEY